MSSIDITNVVFDHFSNSLGNVDHFVVQLPNGVTGAEYSTGLGTAQLGQYIGAGLSMIGAMGVGISQGFAAAAGATAAGRNPEAQPKILNTMIVGMAVTEAAAIYSLIVAILIIFVA